MEHKGTEYLVTERLILRRFELSDAEAMFTNWANDEEVTRFLTWPPHADVSVTEAVLKEWIDNYEKPDYYQWAIVLKDAGNEPVGSIGAVFQNEKAELVHIAYCLAKRLWRRGITSEALQAVIDYLFDEVKYGCIQARYDTKNPGSGKVMEKCGMKYEGTLRHADWNNQGICDISYYSILRKEHLASKVEYKRLGKTEINRELFDGFVRTQPVTQCWRKEQGEWLIKDIAFVDDWGEAEYERLVSCLRNTAETGGLVTGAFLQTRLVGFVAVEREPIGSRSQYLDLSSIHVSQDMRGYGIGKRLFLTAAGFAREKGAEKLYISAHSSVESQAFYRAMHCKEAEEYHAGHVEQEPCDCQLECEVDILT